MRSYLQKAWLIWTAEIPHTTVGRHISSLVHL